MKKRRYGIYLNRLESISFSLCTFIAIILTLFSNRFILFHVYFNMGYINLNNK
ncbi:hypothetical protein MM_0065 [Methanosarcina mazei Go1]|uniref:Uncharacterized protein n=1 Tax=Methanosarcina mazei (strain ATCC BAA-159 / DSM 3647 / Goe1 / Go1 / JCM 11833 / OCM 88) TaxID=192952 RepID=Q8Q0S1_METMA|nr:hypothetical protein MM_0065 [Methanosarcina mazei Go1]